MRDIDYSKQLYLYDDRSKYDYFLKVTEIIFQDEDSILCKTVIYGHDEYEGEAEEEKMLIDKTTGEVKNSNFYSWLATSDQTWVDEKVAHMKELNNE